MANFPTCTNPLVLSYTGHIPALKNNRIALTDSEGRAFFGKNDEVRGFLHSIRNAVPEQVRRQAFDKIPLCEQVGLYAKIGFYALGDISQSDGDNALTTLMETTQTERRDRKGKITRHGVAAAIEDDRQITFGCFETKVVRERVLEGATLYLWHRGAEPDILNELISLVAFINTAKQMQTVSKRNINLLLKEI